MVRSRPTLLALISLAVLACGGPTTGDNLDAGTPCTSGIDNDGDDFGAGCPAGPDCDDNDVTIHEGCDPCAADNPQEGCACTPGSQPVSCFDGTPQQASTPPCAKGTRTCDQATSTWGPCDGQTPPQLEMCNMIDDDCDGTADDGVLTACGNCEPGCDTTGAGDGTPFPLPGDPLPPPLVDVGADGVGLDPNGDLILDSDSIEFHFLWVANAGEGTVSKLDTITGVEVARYSSVTHAAVVDVMGVGAGGIPAMGGANSPSRTAVDFYGNVWVANRAFGYQPSATKIMNDPADCTDRNGNGIIETSTDVDANGVITLSAPEFYGEDDECIKFTVVVGASDGWARAAAIDAGIDPGDPGHLWVGMFNEQAFYQINGTTGALMQRVPPAGPLGISPYGAAIDSTGQLWAPNGCCGASSLVSINTVTGATAGPYAQVGLGCGGSYGIAVDTFDKVWVGAWSCASAVRFDPLTLAFTEVPIPGYYGAGWGARGIGADAIGNVWVALHPHTFTNAGALGRVNTTTLVSTGAWDLNANSTAAVAEGVPVGAAVDFNGHVWTVNQNTSNASRLYVDPVTNEPAAHPVTGNVVDTFPVGVSPYTYSDFTGLGLRTVTRPSGDYVVVMEGCVDSSPATWNLVEWDATVPAGTSVEVWVRTGDDLATLGGSMQYGPWLVSPADLQMPPGPVPDGRYMELTIRLISVDRETSPIVHSYDVQWTCPNGLG